MTLKIGLYGRISDDQEGDAKGVARQIEDGRVVTKLRGWNVAREYVDNDLSAYKRKVIRPDFEQMLTDLAARRIDGIVVYDLDRFARQPRDLERAIDIYEDHADLVFATVQGDINLSTADGRTMARVMVAFANKASADTARRVARKHRELADNGLPAGGPRPFGYLPDRVTLDPDEASLVELAVKDVLNGKPLTRIATEWNESGVVTTYGKPWQTQTVRQMLLNPRIAGYRSHQRKMHTDEAGWPIRATWEPIIDLDTWERVDALLRAPERRTSRSAARPGSRLYLLSGIVRCGQCSARLYGAKNGRDERYSAYRCNRCCKTTVGMRTLDKLITDLVLAKVQQVSLPQVSRDQTWPRETELTAARDRISELMDAFKAGRLSGGVVFPSVEELEAEVAALADERSEWLGRQVKVTTPADVTVDEWKTYDISKKRSVIETWLQSVVIREPTKRGPRLDPNRVVPVWREGVPSA